MTQTICLVILIRWRKNNSSWMTKLLNVRNILGGIIYVDGAKMLSYNMTCGLNNLG